LVAGLLIGLALALGVALYITKAPVPFMNKVPLRTAEQDTAEAERNRTWDPNAPLGGKAVQRSAAAAAAASAATAGIAAPAVVPGAATPLPTAAAPPTPAASPARDPSAILAGAATPSPAPARPTPPMLDPFVYFVQAGAYTRTEDAEQQRARLAMLGQSAKITEREQAGRTVFRVRVGPFPSRDEADSLQNKLQEQSIEAQIVRVEKP
jgi:cell division protein FtsN